MWIIIAVLTGIPISIFNFVLGIIPVRVIHIVCYLISIITLCVCLVSLIFIPEKPVNTTTGTIQDFVYEDDSTWPVIQYEIDGEQYEKKVTYYMSTMRKGDTVELQYVDGNPYEVKIPMGHKIGSKIFLILSLCSIVFISLGRLLYKTIHKQFA